MDELFYRKLKATICYAEIDKAMADFAATKNLYGQVLYHRQQAVEKYLLCIYYLCECEPRHGKTHKLKTILNNIFTDIFEKVLDTHSNIYKAVAFFSPYNSVTRYALDENNLSDCNIFRLKINLSYSNKSESHMMLIRSWVIDDILSPNIRFEEEEFIPTELIVCPDIEAAADE